MEFANSKESTEQTAEAQENSPAQELDALPQMEKLQLSETGIESSQTQTSVESSSQYDPSKIMAGSTFPRASARKDHKPPSHTFSDCDTSSFQLRVGPNYAKTGAKAPAGPSLYEVAGMDFVRCGARIDDFASKVNLPEEWTNIDTHNTGVPPLFIVNVQLPEDFSTSFFTTRTDGAGWSLETAAALRDLKSASPALRLFAQYCKQAPEALRGGVTDATWAGRFKIILRCEDIEQFGLPSFITSYNSKPVLIRNTGTLVRGVNYVEMDINVHKFASLPKRALESMFNRFDKMCFSCAFCIESRTDEEMPEALFGAAQINAPVHQLSPVWKS